VSSSSRLEIPTAVPHPMPAPRQVGAEISSSGSTPASTCDDQRTGRSGVLALAAGAAAGMRAGSAQPAAASDAPKPPAGSLAPHVEPKMIATGARPRVLPGIEPEGSWSGHLFRGRGAEVARRHGLGRDRHEFASFFRTARR
jgi:hypothetical protein